MASRHASSAWTWSIDRDFVLRASPARFIAPFDPQPRLVISKAHLIASITRLIAGCVLFEGYRMERFFQPTGFPWSHAIMDRSAFLWSSSAHLASASSQIMAKRARLAFSSGDDSKASQHKRGQEMQRGFKL